MSAWLDGYIQIFCHVLCHVIFCSVWGKFSPILAPSWQPDRPSTSELGMLYCRSNVQLFFQEAERVIWNCLNLACALTRLSSSRKGVARNCMELQDFVFHCRVYKELHGTARSPKEIWIPVQLGILNSANCSINSIYGLSINQLISSSFYTSNLLIYIFVS